MSFLENLTSLEKCSEFVPPEIQQDLKKDLFTLIGRFCLPLRTIVAKHAHDIYAQDLRVMRQTQRTHL